MGALGCGELLMQLVLEEMEAAHAFDYAVVQATESSAGFYDKMGFVRVGAIAKYIKPGHTSKNAYTHTHIHTCVGATFRVHPAWLHVYIHVQTYIHIYVSAYVHICVFSWVGGRGEHVSPYT